LFFAVLHKCSFFVWEMKLRSCLKWGHKCRFYALQSLCYYGNTENVAAINESSFTLQDWRYMGFVMKTLFIEHLAKMRCT
jgi:hypothetical protein